MTDYFIDDGGDNTTGLGWATAWNSIGDMLASATPKGTVGDPFASTDRLIFGADSVDAYTYTGSANIVVTGPASGLPCILLSSTVGTGTTVSYTPATSYGIDTTDINYALVFDGAFAAFGLKIKSYDFNVAVDSNEALGASEDCTISPHPGRSVAVGASSNAARYLVKNITADLRDTTNSSTTIFSIGSVGGAVIQGGTVLNGSYRTGVVFSTSAFTPCAIISGMDFTSLTNATLCELFNASGRFPSTISNCLTAATWAPFDSSTLNADCGDHYVVNTGPADAPTYLVMKNSYGLVTSASSIYRSGGATVEGDACAWLVTTDHTGAALYCSEATPFYTPWIYNTVASTGSKTFDLYITNDTADFTDAEVWLEVEYLSTADEAIWALATDQRATITTTAAAQTDDTTSTWTGTGPSFTYKQKLSVTATVGETGQYRARVAVGVASIAGSRYFYVDPKVTVS